jgi:hypothetical protein
VSARGPGEFAVLDGRSDRSCLTANDFLAELFGPCRLAHPAKIVSEAPAGEHRPTCEGAGEGDQGGKVHPEVHGRGEAGFGGVEQRVFERGGEVGQGSVEGRAVGVGDDAAYDGDAEDATEFAGDTVDRACGCGQVGGH